MERGSWLWRRRSSEKNPCETESSGSTCSPSERYSDDQVCQNLGAQSAEVSSNDDDEVKTLTDKLSAALRSISEKEVLINQHAKVAEEAVSGWEKAESEVVLARQQVDVSIQKNTVLEARVLHLDEALKECVKQLRQTREDQEEKIREAISVKSLEWRQNRSELVNEIASLKTELRASPSSEALKAELQLQRENLRRRTVERDLSVRAAEAASKQYLESMKKAVRLESECRRLKSVPRKPYDQASSTYVESIDSRSDSGEVDDSKPSECRSGAHRTVSFSLMDDFLEMEKFAESSAGDRPELDMLLRRIAELERSSAKVEDERRRAERDSVECRHQLRTSKARLNDMEAKLVALQKELDSARERNGRVEVERDTCLAENLRLLQRIESLAEETTEGNLKAEETSRRCRELDGELSRLKLYIARADVTAKAKQEEGQRDAAAKLAVCQQTISSMAVKIRSLAMVDGMVVSPTA